MRNEEFRRAAHQMVDWMADYLETLESRPVTPDVKPGDIRSRLPQSPPASAEPLGRLMADTEQLILPGMTHWGHPGFFAYFPATASPPSILAEMMTATLAAQCMSWQTSPAATELEQVTMDWLRQMIGLPDGFTGVIQDTSSTATLVSLLTARERANNFTSGAKGLSPAAPMMVYASSERHSSVDKAVRLAGYGLDNLRLIEVDEQFALKPEALEQLFPAVHNAALPAELLLKLRRQAYWRFYRRPRTLANLALHMTSATGLRKVLRAVRRRIFEPETSSLN